MEQLSSHCTDFCEILHLIVFLKPVEKVKVCLKSSKTNGYFTPRPKYIYGNILLNYSQNETCFRQTLHSKSRHISCSITFFRKSCRLEDNVEKYGTAGHATDEDTIQGMRFAWWMTKATDIHLGYHLLLFHGNNGYAKASQC